MNTTESTRIIEVAPALAQQWLSECKYDSQRGARKWAVDYYASEMQKERFKQLTQIEMGIYEGKRYLIDGQHRLLAVVKSGIPQRFTLLEVPVKTQEELDYRYAQTDRGVGRTVNDQYRSLNLPLEFGLSETQTGALGSAVMLIRGEFGRAENKGVSFEDKLSLMREYSVYAGYFYEVTAGAILELRHALNRQATLAVALITYRYSAEQFGVNRVDEFWQGVSSDNGLQVGDPRKVAHRHLLLTGMVGGVAKGRYKERISAGESARYLANCFNAYVEQRPLSFTRVSSDTPIRIVGAGSKYNGRQATKAAA